MMKKNDVYIHVDKRTDNCPFESKNSAQKSHLFWVKQQRVNWGGASQIYVELNLLKKATETHHSYYHLLSGTDFPIKIMVRLYLMKLIQCLGLLQRVCILCFVKPQVYLKGL